MVILKIFQTFLLVSVAVSAVTINKIGKNLGQSQFQGKPRSVIVTLASTNEDIIEFIDTASFPTREDRLNALGSALKSHASQTQASVLKIIQQTDPSQRFDSLWISNQIFLPNASPAMINRLAQMEEVSKIEQDEIIKLIDPSKQTPTSPPTPVPSVNSTNDDIGLFSARQVGAAPNAWGIDHIHASNAWRMYNNGSKVIVAIIDSGVNFNHEALKSSYRGLYGWFDPYAKTPIPNDQFGNAAGHGTHVMGTIVGSKGIGVAPGAQWMACKGCQNGCSQSALISCGQFLTCPTLWNGNTPNCTKAPHVINNSWGGGQGKSWYDSVIKAWRAARIIPVFAAGNSGPSCGTLNYPGENPDVITVGASASDDTIAYFSSKGPTVNGLRKPDVSAPGVDIKSAGHNGPTEYTLKDGTSMASPHITGIIALILSQKPKSTYDQVKNNLVWSANIFRGSYPNNGGYTCGGIPETRFPNNIYGAGIVDAIKAVYYAEAHNK